MDGPYGLHDLETSIIRDKGFVYTLVGYGLILAIYVNSYVLNSWIIGIIASSFYVMINGIFLGNVFSRVEESSFLRFAIGVLTLIILIGLVGLLVLLAYDLDLLRSVSVLFVVSTIASLLSRITRNNGVAEGKEH